MAVIFWLAERTTAKRLITSSLSLANASAEMAAAFAPSSSSSASSSTSSSASSSALANATASTAPTSESIKPSTKSSTLSSSLSTLSTKANKAEMVVGQAAIACTMCFKPSSIRRAISTSLSRVSKSTVPISRMYMRTGSVVRPKSESTVASACSASSSVTAGGASDISNTSASGASSYT